MNKQESDILNALLLEPFINQRILAEVSGHSLGVVNRSLKELIKADYLDESIFSTRRVFHFAGMCLLEAKGFHPCRQVGFAGVGIEYLAV